MQVGAVFPQLEIGTDPDTIAAYARKVEELGYDHLVIFDHVLGADASRPGGWTGVYDHRSLFHEPFVLYGYLAAITTRLRLATAVIVLPQRQTALVAKQAVEVDVLSRGRLILGVGIGWNQVEYEALGMRFTDRGRRIEEQIGVLRLLFTHEVVDLKRRWHRIDRAGINPLPVQRPIPIWMGGGWDRRERKIVEPALRRIARIADGWFTHLPPNDDGRAGMDMFRRFVREAGRDPAKVPVEGRIAASGGPEDWKRGIDAFREMGMTGVELTTMGAGYRGLDEHLDVLRRFRELT
ncbi:MAG TPA: LLM class F420-dependent oxidoreductase [Candidatus Limnocylindria bacterium]|jgi:probable F420-dependent oxidoreductase|nr:LLM class F420-dependent oxidoreductase [Candidatus Limnocylindria bacterium]